jgi:hypothetical protein
VGRGQEKGSPGLKTALSFSLADIGVIFAICGSLSGALMAFSNAKYVDRETHIVKHQTEYAALTAELRSAREEMKEVRGSVSALLCFLRGGSDIGGECVGRRTGDLPSVTGRLPHRPLAPTVRASAPANNRSSASGVDSSVGKAPAPHTPAPASPSK